MEDVTGKMEDVFLKIPTNTDQLRRHIKKHPQAGGLRIVDTSEDARASGVLKYP